MASLIDRFQELGGTVYSKGKTDAVRLGIKTGNKDYISQFKSLGGIVTERKNRAELSIKPADGNVPEGTEQSTRPTAAIAGASPSGGALLQTQKKAENLWDMAVDQQERYRGYEERYQNGESWSGVSSNITEAQTKMADLDSQIEELQMQIEQAEYYLSDPNLTYAPRDGRDGREVAQEEITAWKYALGALETERKVLQSQLDTDNELYSYIWGRTFSDMGQDEAYDEYVEKGKQRYQEAETGYKDELKGTPLYWISFVGGVDTNSDVKNTVRKKYPIYITLDDLSEEEQQNFYYLLGKGKDDIAVEYVNEIASEATREKIRSIKEWAGTNTGTRFLASVGSIAALPFAGLDFGIEQMSRAQTGLSPSTYQGIGARRDALRSGTAEGLTEKGLFNTGFLAGTADLPLVGEKGIGDVYSLGMSAADSAIAGALFGPTGASLVLGSSAASSAFNNALANGASYEQALTQGMAQGAAEVVFEKISLEGLFGDSLDGVKNKVLKAFAQGGIEASEEFATSVSNLITDQWIMGAESEYNRLVQDYKSNGWTEEAAKEKAEKDILQGLMTDVIGGLISGGAMSGGYSAINAIANRNSGKNSTPDVSESSEQTVEQDSTAINDDPAEHTPEEMQSIEAYKSAVDEKLVEFVEQSKKGGKANDTFQLAKVSKNAASDIKSITGIDVNGFSTAIERRQIWHILKRHGENGRANQSMSDVNDIGRIQYILDNYDTVTAGGSSSSYTTIKENGKTGQAPVVLFSKKIDGTYYVAEAVPNTKRKTLFVTSAFISQNGQKETGTSQLVNAQMSPVETPKASSASIPVDGSIAQSGRAVNTDEGLVYEILLDMGVHKAAAESLVGNLSPKEGMSSELFARGIGEAFLYGMTNFSVEEMAQRGSLSADLSEQQRNYAYELGKTFRKDQIADREKTIQQRKKAAGSSTATRKKGRVQFEGNRIKEENLTEIQKASVKALGKLAEALGVDFYLYQSEKGADGRPIGLNGWYDHKTGSIHIDLNAGEYGDGTILFTAAHELSHFLHQWSPSKFKTLADFLAEQYGKKGQSVTDLIQLQQDKARRNGRSLSWMQAYEEMVADSMETMLTDGKVMEKLAELRTRDKSLVQKIKEWFREFAAKLKNAYQGLKPDTQEGRMVAEMVDAVQQLQELFAEGLAEAGENYRAAGAQKNNAPEGDVKYSIRENFYSEIDAWDGKTKQVFRVGKTSDVLKSIGVRDLGVIWHGGKIAEIMRKHQGMTREVIKQVPQILEKPVIILASKNSDSRLVMFGTVTDHNGAPVTAVLELQPTTKGGQVIDLNIIASAYGKDSNAKRFVESSGLVYLDPNRNRTGKWMQSVGLQLPSDAITFGSIGRISYPDGKVKIESVPYEHYMRDSKKNESHSARGNITVRSVLTDLDASTVENDIERKHLLEYQENSRKQLQEQKKLDELQTELEALQAETGRKDTKRIRYLKDEIIKTKNRIGNYAGMLQREENGWQLEKLIQREVKAALAKAVDKYGAIPAGERAAEDRTVQMPRSMDGKTKVSRVARSAAEAQMTPKEFVPKIEQAVVDGLLSYDPDTNKKQMERAQAWLEYNGLDDDHDDAYDEWIANVSKAKKLTKDDVARGILLYDIFGNMANNATNEKDRIKYARKAIRVLSELQTMVTESAQMVQAMHLMKKQAPEMQYYALQRSVKKLSDDLSKKLPEGIQINETLAANWMQALRDGDEERIKTAQKALYRDLAAQIPTTFREKWNAWRYLAMLFNPRTHVKNILGNLGFAPVKLLKDTVATFVEWVGEKASGGRMQRTKTIIDLTKKADRSLWKVACADYANVQDLIQSGGKYNDSSTNEILRERAVFTGKLTKPVEWLRKLNEKALDAEDMWFSKPTYATALAGYLKIHGISAEQIGNGDISEAQLNTARAYAIKEAAKATYRDTNEFSTFISNIGKHKTNSKVLSAIDKGAGILVDGALPFKKTPANILVRGAAEYSVIGLVRGIKQLSWDVAKGNRTAAEAIDTLASGFVGTGLTALGAWLCAIGWISGVEDDEEKRRFGELQGKQSYALNIGDKSYTIDWLAPEALPVFVGVELAEAWREKDGKINTKIVLEAVGNITEPLLEMSMLSGLNDLLDDISYADNKLMTIATSAATNYLVQFVPSIFGSIERSTEDKRYTTYINREDEFLLNDWQYLIANLGNKSPGEYKQIPFIDAWGREEDTGDVVFRLFSNFVSPGYYSEEVKTPVDDELTRLYDAGFDDVFPDRVAHSYKIDERYLSAEEYITFAKIKGQTSLEVLQDICSSAWYTDLDDTTKAEAIEYAYDYAAALGKKEAVQYESEGWLEKAIVGADMGIEPSTFIQAKIATGDIAGVKNAEGNTIPNSRGLLVMREIYKINGLTDEQRQFLFVAFGVGSKVIGYSEEEVNRIITTEGYDKK